jgi:hypothetical protein
LFIEDLELENMTWKSKYNKYFKKKVVMRSGYFLIIIFEKIADQKIYKA